VHRAVARKPAATAPLRRVLGHARNIRTTERYLANAVQEARAAGASWDVIGAATGLTGEGAKKRWGAS